MGDPEARAREERDQADDAETMARLREEISNLPVSEHVAYMLHSLSALAVGRLGLTADTAARRDLVDARLAIEAFKALLGVLEQVLPSREVTAYRGMLSQLQLAYVGASGEQPPPPSGGEAQGEAEATEEIPATSKEAAAKKEPVAKTKSAAKKVPKAGRKPASPPGKATRTRAASAGKTGGKTSTPSADADVPVTKGPSGP